MLEHANDENYLEPYLYDLESGPFDLEGALLFDLAREASGPVLDLGCGTGRVTIPIAQRGVDITGIDSAPEMINLARRKAGNLPIRWICADARSFQINSRYAVVYTVGGVFQHLLNRNHQEAMLARVREHLASRGKFVIDATLPKPAKMVDVLEEVKWFSYEDHQGREVTVSGTDQYDHLKGLWHQTYYRRWSNQSGRTISRRVRLTLRYFMPQEMESLLSYNGFKILDRFGDWSGAPLEASSDQQIYVCKKQK